MGNGVLGVLDYEMLVGCELGLRGEYTRSVDV